MDNIPDKRESQISHLLPELENLKHHGLRPTGQMTVRLFTAGDPRRGLFLPKTHFFCYNMD